MQWQPIETAPKDERILLYRPTAGFPWARVVIGRFDSDRYAKRPRPYWPHELEWVTGKTEGRAANPTHWMPLPGPPSDA